MSSPPSVVSRLTALAVSIDEPPPTAMKPSHGPCALAYPAALSMLSSVGSTWTPSKISARISYLVSESAIRCGRPAECTVASVMISTRSTPYWDRSKPISSTAPGPNFRGGAPQVKIVSSVCGVSYVAVIGRAPRPGSAVAAGGRRAQLVDLVGVVAEDHGRVRLLGDAADLLHRGVELLEVVHDRGGHGGRPVAGTHVDGVGGEDHRAGLGQVHPHRHAARRVPWRLEKADPRQEVGGVTGDGLELEPFVVGLEVRTVERPVEGVTPLVFLVAADELRVRVLEQIRVAGVVEVQVREDDVVDVTGGEAHLLEAGVQVLVLGNLVVGEEVLQAGRGPALLPVAGAAGVPQQPAVRGVDEDGVGRAVDPLGRLVLGLPRAHRAARGQQQPGDVGAHRAARQDADGGLRGHGTLLIERRVGCLAPFARRKSCVKRHIYGRREPQPLIRLYRSGGAASRPRSRATTARAAG